MFPTVTMTKTGYMAQFWLELKNIIRIFDYKLLGPIINFVLITIMNNSKYSVFSSTKKFSCADFLP